MILILLLFGNKLNLCQQEYFSACHDYRCLSTMSGITILVLDKYCDVAYLNTKCSCLYLSYCQYLEWCHFYTGVWTLKLMDHLGDLMVS